MLRSFSSMDAVRPSLARGVDLAAGRLDRLARRRAGRIHLDRERHLDVAAREQLDRAAAARDERCALSHARSTVVAGRAPRPAGRPLTTWYSTRPGFLKPRFGRRRWIGIWPPSNHAGILPPERAFLPLWPLPAVPPRPLAAPLPRRFVSCVAPAAGRIVPIRMVTSYVDLLHLHQVADLEDHAPDLGRVVVLDGLLHAADAERAHRRALILRVSAGALRSGVILSLRAMAAPLRRTSPSSVRPRIAATSDGRRSRRRPSTVALTRLCGLREPRHLVSTFCTPATSSTARTPRAGDHAGSGRGRLEQHFARAEVADRSTCGIEPRLRHRHLEHVLLRRLARLADGVRDFVGLAEADADAAVLVADRHDRVEREPPAALHHLGAAIHLDHALRNSRLGCASLRTRSRWVRHAPPRS